MIINDGLLVNEHLVPYNAYHYSVVWTYITQLA